MVLLTSGQTLIITIGLTMSLAVTVVTGPGGRLMTPGELVLMQGMILQLWAPLSFFGWFYRYSMALRSKLGFSSVLFLGRLGKV